MAAFTGWDMEDFAGASFPKSGSSHPCSLPALIRLIACQGAASSKSGKQFGAYTTALD